MFFLLDAKITILYNGKISKKIILNVAKKTENELISCNIQNDKS